MKWLAILAFLSGGLLWSLTQTQPAKSDVLQLETYHEPCGGVSEDYEYILIRWVDSSGNTVRTLYLRRPCDGSDPWEQFSIGGNPFSGLNPNPNAPATGGVDILQVDVSDAGSFAGSTPGNYTFNPWSQPKIFLPDAVLQ